MSDVHDPDQQGPKIRHEYLTKGDGSPLEFLEYAEGEVCPLCSKGAHGSLLGILSRSQRDELVHCVKCDYFVSRPPKLFKHRFTPMNSQRNE